MQLNNQSSKSHASKIQLNGKPNRKEKGGKKTTTLGGNSNHGHKPIIMQYESHNRVREQGEFVANCSGVDQLSQ